MKRALWEFTIDGIDNNIDFQLEILNHPKFIDGKFDTGFINKEIIK